MSFSAGVFSIDSTGQPVVTGTTISSSVFNAFTADIATGLSTAVLKDGTQTITANIPMSTFKLTGLAAGSANGDSVRYEQLAMTISTEQATTSGTSIDFTGIPSATRKITIMFVGVSTNGTSNLRIQIGDSGGFETTGYSGACTYLINAGAIVGTTSGGGFLVTATTAASDTLHGKVVLDLENASAFTWTSSGNLAAPNTQMHVSGGSKSLSAELTQIRITTVNGTDAFDAGVINISYRP